MSKISQSKRQATISDWLKFNGLTRKAALRQLALIEPIDGSAFDKAEVQPRLGMRAKEAWTLCAEAMREVFPVLKPEIDQIEANAPKCLQPKNIKHPKPFTYDLGFQNLPFVSLHYQDRPADLLAVAHEFGHAVQIVASWRSREVQMPPVARECCAFMAELSLLTIQIERAEDLSVCHQMDDVLYLEESKTVLKSALLDDQSPYRYDWNYPLARQLAGQLMKAGETDQAAAIFRSGQDGGFLLAQHSMSRKHKEIAT